MRDDCVTLHLTRHQREIIRRQTGKDPLALIFRLGELRERIVLREEEEDLDEGLEARLEELLHAPV